MIKLTKESRKLAELVTKYVAAHSSQESALLYPNPIDRAWIMSDPHGLLDLLKKELRLSPEVIDAWTVEANEENKDA